MQKSHSAFSALHIEDSKPLQFEVFRMNTKFNSLQTLSNFNLISYFAHQEQLGPTQEFKCYRGTAWNFVVYANI